MTTIPLGFEVGTGQAVEIPIRHMAVCGQTQEAGKTTALEGLIARSGKRALTFVTKRGEGAFQHARAIRPYFREQADWKFVAAILEASRGEKLKFERAWIIRASRGARTLADVQRNVRTAMKTAKGLAGDVYLTLDAYLDEVVPYIGLVQWATTVDLQAGVNVMDLTDVPLEMQHLVIKSSIDWVLQHARDTVLVIPEAWKFIPQGRGTPVKLSAAAFIRQGAALGNYLWLDSQDLGGIEKEILRSVPVWLLGVQRESNEIKRTLSNIPASVAKPTAAAIATLELGQFFACWGKHAIRTYAQPAWMNAAQAEQVATGALAVELASRLSPRAPHVGPRKELTIVTNEEAARLTRENDTLREENADLRRRLEALEKGQHDREGKGAHRSVRPLREQEAAPNRAEPTPSRHVARARGEGPGGEARQSHATNGHVEEATYQAIKARLLMELPSDPVLLRVFASQPELEVSVRKRTIEASEETLRGRLALLIRDGFFDEAKAGNAAFVELQRRGFATAKPNVYREADKLAADGFLTKEADGYRAVSGMKVNVVEA